MYDKEKDNIPDVLITPVAFQRVDDDLEIDKEFMITMFMQDIDLLEQKLKSGEFIINDLPF